MVPSSKTLGQLDFNGIFGVSDLNGLFIQVFVKRTQRGVRGSSVNFEILITWYFGFLIRNGVGF